MASPSVIPLSLPRANPTLRDVLTAWKTDVMLSTNCHGIATIQAVRITTTGVVVVDATMNYSRTYYEKESTVDGPGQYVMKQLAYPPMIDCPAVILTGGKASLNIPIQVGDQCLILFNDRDLNNWFAGAHSGPVATSRLHSFADAIALVGFNNPSFSLDLARAVLTDGNAKVGFNTMSDLLTLQNSATSLKTVLGHVTDALTALNAVTGSPATVPIAEAISAISNLLE